MKHLRRISATFVILLALSMTALAAEIHTPGRSGEINTPGIVGEVHTPGIAGDVSTPGIAGELWIPAINLIFSLFS